MKVLVTGSSGFVGEALVRALAAQGMLGIAVSRREQTELPAEWRWIDRERCLQGRISGPETPDWVIHLEVKHHVPNPGPADLAEFEAVNCAGTQRWLEWCAARGVKRFVYFSSIKAVGDAPSVQDEAASSEPNTPYGMSKRRGENCVRQWAEADRSRIALILRPAVIYGPGSTANIASMIRAIDRGYFFLVGRNDNVKSLVSLANVVAAVTHLVGRDGDGVNVYNLVDPESYPVRTIAAMIARQLRLDGKVRTLPSGLAVVAANISEAMRKLTGRGLPLSRVRLKALTETTHFSGARLLSTGFRHPQSTEAGLAEMIAWYRTQIRR